MEEQSMKEAFLEAFESYGDSIFRFCLVKTSSKELSEDLTQETFIRFWQSLQGGKEMTNTRSYLYTIANNLVIDWYRKRKEDSLDARVESGFEPTGSSGSDIVTDAELREMLEVIEEMEEEDREILLLRFVEELPPREIAEALGVTANVVSVRIHRAMKRLQEKLKVNDV